MSLNHQPSLRDQDGLSKSDMEKLTFYAVSAPEKLDRIGAYLAERLSRDVVRHRYGWENFPPCLGFCLHWSSWTPHLHPHFTGLQLTFIGIRMLFPPSHSHKYKHIELVTVLFFSHLLRNIIFIVISTFGEDQVTCRNQFAAIRCHYFFFLNCHQILVKFTTYQKCLEGNEFHLAQASTWTHARTY